MRGVAWLVLCASLCAHALAEQPGVADGAADDSVAEFHKRLGALRKRFSDQLDSFLDDVVQDNEDLQEPSPSLSASAQPVPSPSPLSAEDALKQITMQLHTIGAGSDAQKDAARALMNANSTQDKANAIHQFANSLSSVQLDALRNLSQNLSAHDSAVQSQGQPPLLPRLMEAIQKSDPQLFAALPVVEQHAKNNGSVALKRTLHALNRTQGRDGQHERDLVTLIESDEGVAEGAFDPASILSSTSMLSQDQLTAAKEFIHTALGASGGFSAPEVAAAAEKFKSLLSSSQLEAARQLKEMFVNGKAAETYNPADISIADITAQSTLNSVLKLANTDFAQPTASQLQAASSLLGTSAKTQPQDTTELFLQSLTPAQREALGAVQTRLREDTEHVIAAAFASSTASNADAAARVTKLGQQLEAVLGGLDSFGLLGNVVEFVENLVVSFSVALPAVGGGRAPERLATALSQYGIRQVGQASSAVDSLLSLGARMDTFNPVNTIKMVTNVLGVNGTKKWVDDALSSASLLPPLNKDQLRASQKLLLACGLGNDDQSRAVSQLVTQLSPAQQSILSSHLSHVLSAFLISLTSAQQTTASCNAIVEVMARIGDTRARRGEQPVLDPVLVDMAQKMECFGDSQRKQQDTQSRDPEVLQAVQSAFSKFFPLVDQAVLAAAVIPTVRSARFGAPIPASDAEIALAIQTEAFELEDNESDNGGDSTAALLRGLAQLGSRQVHMTGGLNPMALFVSLVGATPTAQDGAVVDGASVQRVVEAVFSTARVLLTTKHLNTTELDVLSGVVESLTSPSLELARPQMKQFLQMFGNGNTGSAVQNLRKTVGAVARQHMLDHETNQPLPQFVRLVETEVRRFARAARANSEDDGESKGKEHLRSLAQEQAMGALLEAASQGPFVDFLPLFTNTALCTFVILPSLQTGGTMREDALVSLIVSAVDNANANIGVAAVSVANQTHSQTLADAFVGLGEVFGRVNPKHDGANAVDLNAVIVVKDAVGDHALNTLLSQLLTNSSVFSALSTADQVAAAKQVVMSLGLGRQAEFHAISQFMNTLTSTQAAALAQFQRSLISMLMPLLFDAKLAQPSPAFVDAIHRKLALLREQMQQKRNQGKQANEQDNSDGELQALFSVDSEQQLDKAHTVWPQFRMLFPLVQTTICRAVANSLVSWTERRKQDPNNDASQSNHIVFVAMAQAAHIPTSMSQFMSSTEVAVQGLIAIGKELGQNAGFNPAEMLTDVIGYNNTTQIVHRIMLVVDQLVAHPEDVTPALTEAANKFVTTTTEQTEHDFMSALSENQRGQLQRLYGYSLWVLVSAMHTVDNQPSPALLADMQRFAADLQAAGNSTYTMDHDLVHAIHDTKAELVASALPHDAVVQATMLLNAVPDDVALSLPSLRSQPRVSHLLPLLTQVVMMQCVVLPLVSRSEPSSLPAWARPLFVETTGSEHGLESLRATGKLLGQSSGINPIQIAFEGLIADKAELDGLMSRLKDVASIMPQINNATVTDSAKRTIDAIGQGMHKQQVAFEDLYQTLNAAQRSVADQVQGTLTSTLMSKLMKDGGRASVQLCQQIQNVLSADQTTPLPEEALAVACELSVRDATATEFSDFFSVTRNVLLAAIVASPPSIAASNKIDAQGLTSPVLLKGIAQLSRLSTNGLSDTEVRSAASDTLAMFGHAASGFHGPNPYLIMTNMLGVNGTEWMLSTIANSAPRVPALTETQQELAKKFLASFWKGAYQQAMPANELLGSLTADQRQVFDDTYHRIVGRFVKEVSTPSGLPTPALVHELLQYLQDPLDSNAALNSGLSNFGPDSFKDQQQQPEPEPQPKANHSGAESAQILLQTDGDAGVDLRGEVSDDDDADFVLG